MKKRHPLAVALVAGALLLCGWESAPEAAAPAQAPALGSGPAQSSPASTVRQGEGSPAASPDGAGQALFVEVKGNDAISASVKNRPLDELLKVMSQKNLFEIRGSVPRGEAITVEFSNLTLEQVLKKIMKGYNYVLVDQGTSRKPLLMVMGPSTRSAYGEQGQAPPTPQPVIKQPLPPGGSSASPAPAVEQPGTAPPPQSVPRGAAAAAQEGGGSPGQPQAPVAQPPANQPQPVENQPQPGSPPGVSSAVPNQGEGPAGQPQPQQQPPVQGAQQGEAPASGSMRDTLPSGF